MVQYRPFPEPFPGRHRSDVQPPDEPGLRYNVVDPRGVVSFVGPGHLGKMLTAAASVSPATLDELLAGVRPLDRLSAEHIRGGLLTFDEFVVDGDERGLDAWRAHVGEIDRHPFRVATAELRQLSLTRAELGLVIVNLLDRRIVQLENRYGVIERADRGRVRLRGRPVARYYEYTLPDAWALVL